MTKAKYLDLLLGGSQFHKVVQRSPKVRLIEPALPVPWSIEEGTACFIVRDHDKQVLAYEHVLRLQGQY